MTYNIKVKNIIQIAFGHLDIELNAKHFESRGIILVDLVNNSPAWCGAVIGAQRRGDGGSPVGRRWALGVAAPEGLPVVSSFV